MKDVAMYTTSQLFGEKTTGGLKRFLELYKGLITHGIKVDLYTADSPDILNKYNVSAFSIKSMSQSNSIFIPTELKILIANRNIIKKIKHKHYDAVIVFDVPTAIGLCLAGIKNIHLFIRQDLIAYKKISISEKTRNKLLQNIYLFFMKLCEAICLIKATKIVVQCKYDYYKIISRHRIIKYLIRNKFIIQINNVNPSWIVENSEIANINSNESKGNNFQSFTIGFIGNFNDERKGQKLFIKAIKNLIDRGFQIRAFLIGDGKKQEIYKKECNSYPMINFMGRLENPIKIIKECDLIVVPSLADSCPNTVMEALYNETPVIGARTGGIPEILDDKDALFEPNVASLQKKIEHMLNRDNLNKLRKQQKQRKKELEFDWSSAIIKHLDIQ